MLKAYGILENKSRDMKKGKIFFEKEKITLEKLFPVAALALRSRILGKNEKYSWKT